MNDAPFIFESYAFDQASHTLRLRYAFEGGAAFEEVLCFPPATRPLSSQELRALDASFRLIFLLAGVSYYKALAPRRLICRAFPLDAAMAAFLEKTYRNGLGEYAYRNTLDLSDRVHFAIDDAPAPQTTRLELPDRLLVPVGGGKDSVVALEALRQVGANVTLFALGNAAGLATPIRECIRVSGLPSVAVARTLSPTLIAMNKQGALNGHVPITAILSSIAVACAILQGCDAVVLSNEHSASAPNLRLGELEINHQYSKSLAFERDFAAIVASHVSPDIGYFSLLRPLTEVAIARRFAAHTAYHDVFRSCNTAFRQDDKTRNKNWCCACPKCRFVFLALAPFVAKERLVEIFGRNLLDDPAQATGFAELCGLAAFKPFECVGEVEECALLLRELSRSAAWRDDAVVRSLPLPPSADHDAAYAELFKLKPDHRVPEKYLRAIS